MNHCRSSLNRNQLSRFGETPDRAADASGLPPPCNDNCAGAYL